MTPVMPIDDHEHGGESGAAACGRPQRQIEQDAGEKPRFSRTEQEAKSIEVPGGGDKGAGRRADAPEHHDAQQRLADAGFFQNQIAGHLEQYVTDEEDTGAEPVDRFGKAEIMEKFQLAEADVGPAQEGQQIAEHQEGNEAQVDLAIGSVGLGGSARNGDIGG